MQPENRPPATNTAKVIVLSIVGTLGVLLVLTYTFRAELKSYVMGELQPELQRLIPVAPVVTTNEERVIAAIETVNPAVVSVIVTKDVPVFEQYYETVTPWGPFGGFAVPRVRENGTEEREVGGGSGFIVSSDGLVVTNRHVVEDESARYTIVLSNGTLYPAEVVDKDPMLDIAVLRISELPDEKLPFVRFGDSTELRLGQTVIAIGNALAEFQNSVSLGIVSGLSRSIVASDMAGNSEQLNQVIQTDAAINPGNSGGPLLNLDGEVVGVNVATSQGADNIGFALPSQLVKQVVTSVQENGEIVRPFLGVRYVMLDPERQEQFSAPISYGALIVTGENESGVQLGSPADEVGLQTGDVIIAIDEVSLVNRDLATELRNKTAGQTVTLVVFRDGTEEEIEVTLARAL
jgi:serine protease Do